MDQEKNRQNQANYRKRHATRLHVLHTYLDSSPFNALEELAEHSGLTKRAIIEQLLIEALERLHSNQKEPFTLTETSQEPLNPERPIV